MPRAIVATLLCTGIAFAQSRAPKQSSRVPQEDRGALLAGTVVNDQTGLPLGRATVVLRPVTGATNGVVAETDEHGAFTLTQIGPGSYSLTASREGYLPNTSARRGPLRLPPVILLEEKLRVRGLIFRLRPWGVVSGKIRYDDGEPAVGAAIQIYAEAVNRGRHSMQIKANTRTDDRGEYRLPALAPGSYFIAATRVRPVAADVEEQEAVDDQGRPIVEYRYATTFYPAAQKLADAVPIRIKSGQEVGGIDIALKPVPAVRLRIKARDALTGLLISQPNITLRRVAPDGRTSIAVPVSIKPIKDGFELTGVPQGPYLITCDAQSDGRRISAREHLLVTNTPIDTLEMLLNPDRQWPGIIRTEDGTAATLQGLRVTLEPRSDMSPSASSDVSREGQFTVRAFAEEQYDIYVQNLPATSYVKKVRIANMDAGVDGLSGISAGFNAPLEVIISSKAASVAGRAFNPDGVVAGGSSIALVPDPTRGRYSNYQFSSADQYGVFEVKGVSPGRYSLFVYYDEAPCNFYDDDALLTCRPAYGQTVNVEEAGAPFVEFRIK